MKPLYWLILSALFFAAGEFYSKRFAMHPSWRNVVAVLVAYLICSALWLPAIRQTQSLATTGVVWSVTGLVVTVLMGAWLFREPVSLEQWGGILLALVATVLLSLPH